MQYLADSGVPSAAGGHPQAVLVVLAHVLVGHDVVEHAGNNDIEHNKHHDVDIQIFQDDVNIASYRKIAATAPLPPRIFDQPSLDSY